MAMLKFEITVDAPEGFPVGDVQSSLVGIQVVQANFYDNGNTAIIVSAEPVGDDKGPRVYPGAPIGG